MSVAVIAGCGGGGESQPSGSPSDSNPDTNNNSNTQAPSGKTTVQFWHSLGGKNGERIDGLIDKFNKSQDQVEVVGTFQGSYAETVTKLQQAVAAKTGPDITMMERAYVQMFAESEVLEDMAPYLEKSDMSLDDFVPGLLGHSVFDDKLVSLPLNRSTPILHVNKTMLDELGLAVPQTWEELKTVAEALVIKGSGENERYGLTMPYDTWYPMAMITQANGKFFNDDGTSVGFANGEGVKVFQFLKDLQNSGALYYPPAQDSGNITNQMFINEKVGMIFQSTGVIGTFIGSTNFDYVTAFLPKDEVYANPTGGANIAMLEASKNKEAAWEFIHWLMTSPEGALNFVMESGYLPFTKSMVESKEMEELWAKEPNRKVAYEQLEHAVDTNKNIAWPQVEQEFFSAIQAIMYDNKDVASTLDNFKKETERILGN
nr:ABC transporter substrate-binding protein [Paenibacillus sp. J2TS4]